MKPKKPNNKICLFYITERLFDLSEIKSDKKLKEELNKFKDECFHNLGVNALHSFIFYK